MWVFQKSNYCGHQAVIIILKIGNLFNVRYLLRLYCVRGLYGWHEWKLYRCWDGPPSSSAQSTCPVTPYYWVRVFWFCLLWNTTLTSSRTHARMMHTHKHAPRIHTCTHMRAHAHTRPRHARTHIAYTHTHTHTHAHFVSVLGLSRWVNKCSIANRGGGVTGVLQPFSTM